jgi:hypothetical protein
MSSINTYFSQKDNLQQVILKNLDAAQNSVSIAVAWFTDVVLFNKLLEIQNRGIKIELIITKHQFNDDSLNDYELISQNNGVFLEIGGNYNTMHHKFCIVDHKILLQGSFNWTKKANESNNETLLVIKEDYQSIHEFNEEFERLKRLAGMDKELKELEIAKALKYFTLIRTFIDLGKPNDIYPYLQEIRDVSELSEIVNLLTSGQYDVAVLKMDELQRNFTAVINVGHFEKEELIFKIRLISEQIKQLEIEKTNIEEEIDSFNRRFILELNPTIAAILQLKKKIHERFNVKDETFEELNQEYEKVNAELEIEIEKNIPDLSQEEQKDIKKMYHEASTLCHPDSAKCVFEDKNAAQETFSALSAAYKLKDVDTVKRIYDELKLGSFNPENLTVSEVDYLKQKLAVLESKFSTLMKFMMKMKTTEPYVTIQKIEDFDEFFRVQKTILENDKEELETKYFKQ